jgi:hypothetical protein
MIKKVIRNLKKVFIPKSEFLEETPKKIEKEQNSYTGVAAPVVTPTDSWFDSPVKSEKVIAYEKHIAQKIEEQKFIEAAQPKKEPEDIHQQMYDRVTKYWAHGKKSTLVVLKTSNLDLVVGILVLAWGSLNE